MPSRRAAFVLISLLTLFVLAQSGAYRSYFQDDDLDTLGWSAGATWTHYLVSLVSWQYFPTNFRPTGHVYYRIMNAVAGLNFPAYVAGLQALHLLNFTLLWTLLRRFQFGLWATTVGVAFWAFHKALLDAYWRPMFVFDVLCATFCLLTLLFYIHGRWVLAFCSFWIAYRAKELAVMVPLVLAAYEYWFGGRSWRRLLPFFAVSLSFGLQAVFRSSRTSGTYTMQFVPVVLWQSARFYAQKLLFAYSGFLVLGLAWLVRDRRLYLGLVAFWLLLVPMLPLPFRQNRVYLYVPLIGAALVVAVVTERWPRLMVPLLGLWLAVCALELLRYQPRELARGRENRQFAAAIRDYVHAHPDTLTYIYDGAPPNMRWWGINGVLSYYFREHTWRSEEMHVGWSRDPRTRAFLAETPRALLHWEPAAATLTVQTIP